MTVDEAIKEIKAWQVNKGNPSYDKLNAALNLGVEALKRELYNRQHEVPSFIELLPGETEE